MDIRVEKKLLQTESQQSIMLAKKAKREYMKNGCVTVVCPKCHEHPEIMMSSNCERFVVRCKCGYIFNGEISM